MDDGGRFEEAKTMFRKGKDINRILQLLAESISINPIGQEKWMYLGGALNVVGYHRDAVAAYCQAVVFDPTSDAAWKSLQDSCSKAGFASTATGLSWFRKILQR